MAPLAFNQTTYDTFLTLHIITVVIGLGAIALNFCYGLQARKAMGPGSLSIIKANAAVSQCAEFFIYAIPVFGFALMGMGADRFGFEYEQAWVVASLLAWFAAVGILHGMHKPAVKKMIAMGDQMTNGETNAQGQAPQLSEFAALGKRAGMASILITALTVIAIALMVYKPGF